LVGSLHDETPFLINCMLEVEKYVICSVHIKLFYTYSYNLIKFNKSYPNSYVVNLRSMHVARKPIHAYVYSRLPAKHIRRYSNNEKGKEYKANCVGKLSAENST